MKNRFQTKLLISLIILIIIAGGVYYFVYKNQKTVPNSQALDTTSMMTGQISDSKAGSIMVKGTVVNKERTVEFIITPETTFKKTTIGITAEQAKSGKPFAPKTTIVSGQASDIVKDMTVRVTAKGDISTSDKLEAKEINYIAHDYQF